MEKVEAYTTSVENDKTRHILTSRLVDNSGKSFSEERKDVTRAEEGSAALAPALRCASIERSQVKSETISVDGIGDINALRSVENGCLR